MNDKGYDVIVHVPRPESLGRRSCRCLVRRRRWCRSRRRRLPRRPPPPPHPRPGAEGDMTGITHMADWNYSTLARPPKKLVNGFCAPYFQKWKFPLLEKKFDA